MKSINNFLLLCMWSISLFCTSECTVIEFKGSPEQFDALLKTGKPVVVKFHQLWCSACKAFKKTFEMISNEFPSITFLAIDASAHPTLEKRFQYGGYPTIIYFDAQGNKVDQKTGGLSAEGLRQKVKTLQ